MKWAIILKKKARITGAAFYAEYNSTGPGAAAKKRVKWSNQLKAKNADGYSAENILKGNDNWEQTFKNNTMKLKLQLTKLALDVLTVSCKENKKQKNGENVHETAQND